MAERLVFDLLAQDHASGGFVKAGRSAAAAADDVLGLARRLDEISKKSVQARVGLAGNKEATAQLDRFNLKLLAAGRKVTADISIEGAAKSSAEITALDAQLDKLGAKSETATAAVGGRGLSGVSGLGALIGAGVAVSPIIATLGTGLAGLGVAAIGVASPIMKAAKAAGGLQANMSKLDPEQQLVAKSLLGLGVQYDAFQASLKPEVLGAFNAAIKIAGSLMHDVEPVAAATGKAFNTFLGQFGATLQDPQWRQFWAFMQETAPQDMRLVGSLVIDLTNDLPHLVEGLQPVAVGFLHVADAVAKVTGAVAQSTHDLQHPNTNTGFWSGTLWDKIVGGAKDLGRVVPHASGALLGIAQNADIAGLSTADLAAAFDHNSVAANAMGIKLLAAATDVGTLQTAQQKALTLQTTYGTDLVTTADDAANLQAALADSGNQIGLHTQKQRDSFKIANVYITDLANTATAAHDSGKGVDAAIKAISDGLPILDSAKSKNKQYWLEVRTLVGWLHRLERIRAIRELIKITGTGRWSATAGELPGQPGRHFVPPPSVAARGMLVTSGRPGVDDQLILAQRGELIVPPPIVRSGAVDHLRGQIPGFADGGIVGAFSGTVPGLQSWAARNVAITQAQIGNAIGDALARSFAAAVGAASSGAAGGPAGGDARANEALARRMFPWPASMWPSYVYLEMREAGFNRFARNPSSGAYGIPQALPPTKMPFAAQAAGGSHAGPQLSWQYGYIGSAYGNPVNAAAHERAFNWYKQGSWDVPVTGPAMVHQGEMIFPADLADAIRRGSPGRTGPLVQINGMVVRDEADLGILASKLGFAITAAGL